MNVYAYLLIIFACYEVTHSSGKLSLKLLKYKNPNHKLSDGSCCEGALCSSSCDNYFKICLTKPSAKRCSLGKKETSVLGDDEFNFGSSLGGGTSNPVAYGFSKWEGSFGLSIEVIDEDTGIFGSDDFVDRYDKNIHLPAAEKESVANTQRITLQGKVSKLEIEFRAFCDDKYLFPNCEEYCVYTDDNTGHYECDYARGMKKCLDGWYGLGCLKKRKNCIPHDSKDGHYLCDRVTGDIICQSGWSDVKSKCTKEINECLSDPCLNGGKCIDLVDDFNCTCKPGYTGKKCEQDINECLSSPCIYGTCRDILNNYTCNCRHGFLGRNCEIEIDECLSNPCIYGSCINTINAFKCVCQRGYIGTMCKEEINECLSGPCKNNATCGNLVDAYNCTCKAGYVGRQCDRAINTELPNTATVLLSNQQTTTARLEKQSKHITVHRPSVTVLSASYSLNTQDSVLLESTRGSGQSMKNSLMTQLITSSDTRQASTQPVLNPVSSNMKLHASSSQLCSDFIADSKDAPKQQSRNCAPSTKLEQAASSLVTINRVHERRLLSTTVSKHITQGPTTVDLRTTSTMTAQRRFLTKVSDKSTIASSTIIKKIGEKYTIREVEFEIDLRGDVKKWNKASWSTCCDEICSEIKSQCTKHSIKCADAMSMNSDNNPLNSNETYINLSWITTTTKFIVNTTASENQKAASDCIGEAINSSAKAIEKKTSFKIVGIKLLKKTEKSKNLASLSPRVMVSSSIPDNSNIVENRLSSKLDRSKLLAVIIVSHIVVITFLLFLIHWVRKQRSTTRITPASDKPLFQNNNETPYIKNKTILDKKPPGESKFEEQTFMKPRALILQSSRINRRSLLENETMQLETLFL